MGNAMSRPALFSLAGVATTLYAARQVAGWIAPDSVVEPRSLDKAVAAALVAYAALLIGLRVGENGANAWYDLLWGCNTSMLVAATGLWTGQMTTVMVVAIDQLCWYVDVVSFLLRGKTLVGVVDYLKSPENRTLRRILTSGHHLFFIPLLVWLLRGRGVIDRRSWLLSGVITSCLGCCGRMVPKELHYRGVKGPVYVNVNAAHEFWRDVKIPFLHLFDRSPAYKYLPFLIIVGNIGLNGLPFLLLSWISRLGAAKH